MVPLFEFLFSFTNFGRSQWNPVQSFKYIPNGSTIIVWCCMFPIVRLHQSCLFMPSSELKHKCWIGHTFYIKICKIDSYLPIPLGVYCIKVKQKLVSVCFSAKIALTKVYAVTKQCTLHKRNPPFEVDLNPWLHSNHCIKESISVHSLYLQCIFTICNSRQVHTLVT